ncbi:inositol monophosphatase [Niallia circulans]|jgi:myo-inositol-1(or 4)-monophosphatase|uniref:inositol-phosphate phosphatase n=1 Tax=Niallia circulans TaxID=1397 RepID=A0A0J1IIK0_NIACI|nr:inositol monophosphatase family protein [Niallia circulans]KLV25823.1 inositol monophosphatase [Niallia circulans]MDR4315736.1 inositol monophosphatase family protein [Niallia circulans]MED3837018.1 inositol monophosphatase family protein [Niallia circulans]MED4244088.1 inositol monophosphatase family protein [Niallia circulans]MED4249178.1 inositol monophosphatase family protein [Niallia circulans]
MTNWLEIDKYAKEWIKEAGARIIKSFSSELIIQTKSNKNDLVTQIDKGTEEFLINKINKVFPSHRILGEEGLSEELEDLKGIVWIIDPIDGTMNFVHMQRDFAISIGIYEDGVGKIGLIYDVVADELYHVRKGNGVFMNDIRLLPLKDTAVDEAIIGLNATWVTKNKRIDPTILEPLVKESRGTRSFGSACLELAYIAAGRMDAYLTLRLSPWDYAAGKIMVEELGGKVTTLRNEPLDLLTQQSFFASKPGLHDEILQKYLKEGNW